MEGDCFTNGRTQANRRLGRFARAGRRGYAVPMPRWLRYLVSISSGLMTLFTFAVLIAGLAKASGADREHLGFGIAFLAVIGSFFVPAIVMLLINDWLANRYPVEPRDSEPRPSVPERL